MEKSAPLRSLPSRFRANENLNTIRKPFPFQDFPHNRDEPGVAAAGDALYVSSGVGSNGDKTYRLDLSSPSPTWEHVATQQGGSYQVKRGGKVKKNRTVCKAILSYCSSFYCTYCM